MYLGSQEMRMVLDRDNLTIQQHLDKVLRYILQLINECITVF